MRDGYQHIFTAKNGTERQRVGALLSSQQIEWEEGENNWLEIWCPKDVEMTALTEVLTLRGEYDARPHHKKMVHQKVSALQISVILLLLIALYLLQHFTPDGAFIVKSGRASATRISDGEVFRGMTALFLHVDIKHLVGNLFFGAIALWSLSTMTGTGVAVLLMLIGGMTGNLFNGLFYGSAHNAIGFSTAVFAAWGSVGAIQFSPHFRQQKMRRWIPFAGTLGMLAMLGSSIKSDVLAHFFGFVAGALLAVVAGKVIEKQGVPRPFWQWFFFLVTLSLILLSWLVVIDR